MSDYLAPLKDMSFILQNMTDQAALMQIPAMAEFSPDLVTAVLEEAAKFAQGVLVPLNVVGDIQGCRFEEGKVITPEGWKTAFNQFCENGWLGLALPEAFGGQQLPKFISMAVSEMWLSANLAFVMFQTLTQGSSEILLKAASDEIKAKYLEKMVSGEWSCCMSLTEPAAGSDLGSIRTKAEPMADGRYRIKGQKIFITYGEHDLTENIVHLVLAKTPGAPEGSKGISLFLVSKRVINNDGSLGELNDVHCVSIEHKTGLHGSPTCSISYGDGDGAIGEMIGEENRGLEYMFILMNEARLSTGLQGVAIGELGYQKSLAYCLERTQGRNAQTGQTNVPIIQHPDVQRMLLGIRAQVMALRSLGYLIAARIDQAEHEVDDEKRNKAKMFVALLTPVFKAFATESGNLMAGTTIQLFGGMGFVEETGVAQLMRDIRITTIYEGTTGIQANDLIFRKVAADKGQGIKALLAEMEHDAHHLANITGYETESDALLEACRFVGKTAEWIVEHAKSDASQLLSGAVPFLEMLAIVASSWQMAKLICAADQKLSEGDDPDYHRNLKALGRFYFVHYLPKAAALNVTFMRANQGLAEYQFVPAN